MGDPVTLGSAASGAIEEVALGAPRIGDRLRQARERRGVSISDASAALKIRIPILEAFEHEDLSQLPPHVYALGQLRTYAAYLGLDPATVVAGWHRVLIPERTPTLGSARKPTSLLARMVALRPGAFRSTQNLLAMGGVGLAMLAISSFMVLQFLRFILPPSIAITYPIDATSNLAPGTLSFEIKGAADAHSNIVIDTSAGTQLTTKVDEYGLWSLLVPLGTGRTEVVAHAIKPGTRGESSTTAERVFVVALPDKVGPEISVIQPATNLAVANGDVPISLVTTPKSEVAITASDTAGGLVTSTITSDASGIATEGISLPAGRWTLSFSLTTPDGAFGQASRTVDVSFSGVSVSVTGGPLSTWIRVWIDGQIDPTIGPSGRTVAPGLKLLFQAATRIDIRSGDPSSLLITLNGRTIRNISSGGGTETYAFLSTGNVQKSSRR